MTPDSETLDPVAKWEIDRSTDNPILTYEKCSVIQDEQAFYVLGLIEKDAATQAEQVPVSDEADECLWTDKPCTCGGGPCEQVNFGDDAAPIATSADAGSVSDEMVKRTPDTAWRFRSPYARGWMPWQLGSAPDDMGEWLKQHEIQEITNDPAALSAAAPVPPVVEEAVALDWAIAEIEGRTRYTSPEQFDRCLEKAKAALNGTSTATGVPIERAPVSDEELGQWAALRADDAGRLARELVSYRRAALASSVAKPCGMRHPLEAYADSYAQMGREGDGRVGCRSVEVDIRQNMIPVTQPVSHPAQGWREPEAETTISGRQSHLDLSKVCAHWTNHGKRCLFGERNWSEACTPTRCKDCPDKGGNDAE